MRHRKREREGVVWIALVLITATTNATANAVKS